MTTSGVDRRTTIERYFAAMRQAGDAEADLMALFADDAVYVEPFSGLDEPAVGKPAIVERFRAGWETPLPDMELTVHSIKVMGPTASSQWECSSPVFDEPVQGTDRYEFDANGLISRLEVTIDNREP